LIPIIKESNFPEEIKKRASKDSPKARNSGEMSVIIRPARSSDLPQVHEIFTHYVMNTCLTFLSNPPPLSFTVNKFEDITQKKGLPFLVAVDGDGDGDGKERGCEVLGYTSLSPFRDSRHGYAPTVELSLYLHPSKVGKGIGSQLLEEVLGLVRRGEVWHAAWEFEGVEEWEVSIRDRDSEGGIVKNVLAVMAVDTSSREEGEGLRRWYAERGFVERGRMKGVGYKMGRW
jgi:L-amino acid N-acyltransferase YncA